MRIARRMSAIEPFHVMEILARAKALEAEGRSIVHMEVGEPDFPTPRPICEAGMRALDKQGEENLKIFESAIQTRPEVMECYLMTGDADYLLRVLVPDVPAFERFILDFLSRVPGVDNIKSSFALKQVKYQTALPLPLPPAAPKGPRRRRLKP